MKPFISELRDQLAHAAAAATIVSLPFLLPSVVGFALAGIAIGLVREITEGGNVASPGSLRDLLFWAIGGAAAGIFIV